MDVVVLHPRRLQGAVHTPADQANAAVWISIDSAAAVCVADVLQPARKAFEDVPELVGNNTCVVAKVLDGGLLLELGAVGAAALIILLAVDVHCGERGGGRVWRWM